MTSLHTLHEDTANIASGYQDEVEEDFKPASVVHDKSSRAIDDSPDTNSSTNRLHPFVHWAQSQSHISLRVDLVQVENLNVYVEDNEKTLTFSAQGRGAHGLQDYHFSLDFHSRVNKTLNCTPIERYVLIVIEKADQVKWPRLTLQRVKLPWLRVDFDRYEDSNTSDNTDSEHEYNRDRQSFGQQQLYEEKQQKREIEANASDPNSWSKKLDNIFRNRANFDIFDPISKRSNKSKESYNMKHDYRKDTVMTDNSKNTAKHAMDYKKTYLFLYNLVMFIVFLKVYIVLVIKGISGTIDDDIVQGAAFIIKVLTYTQLLETIHPMLGLVPGGPLMPFTQVVGRLLVNHFLSEDTIRLDSAPYAHYLFIVWSSIEIFRYSFYALRVFKVNIYPLTWCRYTLFLPLYPMGGLCESMVILSTIKYYKKTGSYSISLPNSANISFDPTMALRIYTFLILGPTIYYLMRYMWKQRCRQLKEKVV